MNAADRRNLTPAIGVVAVALALLLLALWVGLGRGVRWHDQAGAASLPPAGATLPAPATPQLDQYATIWQRPLFSQSRSPAPASAGGGQASGDLQLTGVILLPDLKLAIVHDKTSGRDYRLVQGQPSRNGPALVELKPRSAVVEASGSRLQLRLIPGPSPLAATKAAAPNRPSQAASEPGSAMVSRPAGEVSEAARQSPEARTRALQARLEAARRRVKQQLGGD